MNKSTVKLQIPVDKTLRDRVAKHAKEQGFSSVQDFTRVVYSTIVNNNLKFDLAEPRAERLSPEAEARYAKQLKEFEKDKKAGKIKSYDNTEDFLADLKA
jgi:antitoxin component of RelBE/YafQ-DinJ toxin-antitoxin module